jgi:DNA-binding CsgD family transcriptional regulator
MAALTLREKQVLQLIVKEFTSEEIAKELSISKHTVESHRKNLYKKTKAKTIIGLVNYFYKNKHA